MTNPNQTQAINLLRRLRADSTRPEAEKAAKALIGQIQAQGAMLTVKGLVRTAVAASPNDDASTAVKKMAAQVAMSFSQNAEVQRIFNDAANLEEVRLAPFDAACAQRDAEIKELLEAAHGGYRLRIMNQDLPERRWQSYVVKGLTTAEIKALNIPEPVHGRDLVAERNAWGFELEQVTQTLKAERAALEDFKHSRNENALPAWMLALVQAKGPAQ